MIRCAITTAVLITASAAAQVSSSIDRAYVRNHPDLPPALSTDMVPEVPGIENFIVDKKMATILGKALFWDAAAGSDGNACASCHFHAGADNRLKNQLSPSLLHKDPAKKDKFDPTATGAGGPNYTLKKNDFPFRKLANINDRNSTILFDTDDVASSQGVFLSTFDSVPGLNDLWDKCIPAADPLFNIQDRFSDRKLNTRRVEPRNTPTTINAAFNYRNFWDGRANNVFNGVNPFGRRDPNARVVAWNGASFSLEVVHLINSSLASQAVGPPLSDLEMSCQGREFTDIAAKLLPRLGLAHQTVAANDSVLSGVRDPSGQGLTLTYEKMIKLAFHKRLWSGPNVPLPPSGASQIEVNFALFWGLAIQCYEQTLISDETPFDAWRKGEEDALTDLQITGLRVFLDKGKCINCHKGPDFTGAGFVLQAEAREGGLIERMRMGNNQIALYDNGFYNIGVRPTIEDLGLGEWGPFGHPLSFTRQWQRWLRGGPTPPDPFKVDPSTFEEQVPLPPNPTQDQLAAAFARDNDAVDGAFKTSGLRNIELTGPYMHNGGQSTLEQVVQFYNRGGDVRSVGVSGDTSGFPRHGPPPPFDDPTNFFGPHRSNLDADIVPLNLTNTEQKALVAFMLALTDERVRWEQAPFDHPSLEITDGHVGTEFWSVSHPMEPSFARDITFTWPAVGSTGRGPLGLPPIKAFHTQL